MQNQPTSPEETSEIFLRLEQYDDIFSDFDMRDHSKRAISVDFLEELRRASRDKSDCGIELILHAPAQYRDESKEATIRERLNAHFRRHYGLLLAEKRRVMSLGIGMLILGVISMVAATLILFKDPSKSILLSFLVVFLEPAAWFLLWEGMDQIIFNSKNINPELDFYRKMADPGSRINFKSY